MTVTWYTHTAESRLFWKGLDHQLLHMLPDHHTPQKYQSHHLTQKQQQQPASSMDSTAIIIVQLLFIKQIKLAKKYYMKAYRHTSVLQNDFEQIDYQ